MVPPNTGIGAWHLLKVEVSTSHCGIGYAAPTLATMLQINELPDRDLAKIRVKRSALIKVPLYSRVNRLPARLDVSIV